VLLRVDIRSHAIVVIGGVDVVSELWLSFECPVSHGLSWGRPQW
jgi:hypothetical protein